MNQRNPHFNDIEYDNQQPTFEKQIENLIESTIELINEEPNILNDGVVEEVDLSPRTTPSESKNSDHEQVEKICNDLKVSSGWNASDQLLTKSSNSLTNIKKIPSFSTLLPVTRIAANINFKPHRTLIMSEMNIDSRQLQLVYPLEMNFRPRYKSDYFPQSGQSRRPRYVADQHGHHYVTLKIPTYYQRDVKTTFIRIASITVEMDDKRQYYSPYRFQQDHDDSTIPDVNPLYLPISDDLEKDSTIKLRLVLIKSKSDHLEHAQPLKLFSDTIYQVQNIVSEDKLSPKDFIAKYQLTKSHLAFTICTMKTHQNYEPHPESTCISSIITEDSFVKKNNKNETGSPSPSTIKRIHCPHCRHAFPTGERSQTSMNSSDSESISHSFPHDCHVEATPIDQPSANKKRKTR